MFNLLQKLLDVITESATRLHQRLWLNTNVPGSVEHISILMAGPSNACLLILKVSMMALWDFLPDSKDFDADKKAMQAHATALQWWMIILEGLIFRDAYAFILENVLRVLRQVPQQLCCVTALGDNEL
jgi:hypothetical protein